MIDFDIKKFTRVCGKTQRDLVAGEHFYSVLLPDGSDVKRVDYCLQAWNGPPADAIGCWKSQVPDPKSTKLNWAPSDVMLHYLTQIGDDAERADVRYVLSLLMIRRRILRLDETDVADNGHEVMHLYCTRNDSRHQVLVATPTRERAEVIQNELAKLLFT